MSKTFDDALSLVLEHIQPIGKKRITDTILEYQKNTAWVSLMMELCPEITESNLANLSIAFYIGLQVGEAMGCMEGELE